MTNINNRRVSVIGPDGGGKTTATFQAAQLLSEAYPSQPIQVIDSTGLSIYRDGTLAETRFAGIESIKAKNGERAAKLRTGLFAAARQAVELLALRNNNALTIGVRDPYRVDPASLLPALSDRARRLTPEQRLHLFDTMTLAPHQAHITHLNVDPALAYQMAAGRDSLEPHETPEKIAFVAKDLGHVVGAYATRYNIPVTNVAGLQPDTASKLAESIEPYLPHK